MGTLKPCLSVHNAQNKKKLIRLTLLTVTELFCATTTLYIANTQAHLITHIQLILLSISEGKSSTTNATG